MPEFQRSWVWDNTKICKLIESISSGYPMGAAMFLANGGDSLHFKYRKFTGVSEDVKVVPDWLVLDGQQRLTMFKSRMRFRLVWRPTRISPFSDTTILISRSVLTQMQIDLTLSDCTKNRKNDR